VWDIGPRSSTEGVATWIERAIGDRDLRQLLGTAPSPDDVTDPIGQPIAAYRRLIDELDDMVRDIARALWPPPAK
jgi:hypothetical protein